MEAIQTPLVSPPPGHGCARLPPAALTQWPRIDANGFPYNVLHLFEPPRRPPLHRRYRYVVGVDLGDGVGKDCSSAHVVRVGTVEEPEEEVAHFLSPYYPAVQFAYVLQAIGQAYSDQDGLEALMAIEINANGISCQDMLRLKLGYGHFYITERPEARHAKQRFTNKLGWQTTQRTRGPLLDSFYDAVTARDPVTGLPDLIVNSPATLADMRDFQTYGQLRDAEAAGGGRDDCLMALAIGHHVAWHLHVGQQEPVADRRRRHAAQRQHEADAATRGARYDFRNMAFTEAETAAQETSGGQGEAPPEPDAVLIDDRALDLDGEAAEGVWSSQELL